MTPKRLVSDACAAALRASSARHNPEGWKRKISSDGSDYRRLSRSNSASIVFNRLLS